MPAIRPNFRCNRRIRRQRRMRAACPCPWGEQALACRGRPRFSAGLARTSVFLWRAMRIGGKREARRQKQGLQTCYRRPCRQNRTWAWLFLLICCQNEAVAAASCNTGELVSRLRNSITQNSSDTSRCPCGQRAVEGGVSTAENAFFAMRSFEKYP